MPGGGRAMATLQLRHGDTDHRSRAGPLKADRAQESPVTELEGVATHWTGKIDLLRNSS